MARIQILEVSKIFPSKTSSFKALDSLSLSVEDSEFVCLLGPSGCGKTTLLSMLAGVIQPTTGKIAFERTSTEPGRPLANMVFQEFGLFPWRNVIDNIGLGLELRGVPKNQRRKVAVEYINLVGLKGFEEHYPHQLSGGMKQRVGMARALANDPEILLMDEPFGALDAQTRTTMQIELQRIWAAARKTVVFVTHSIEEAILLADKVAIISARPGRLKELIAVSLPRPRTPALVKEGTYTDLFAHIWESMQEENQRSTL